MPLCPRHAIIRFGSACVRLAKHRSEVHKSIAFNDLFFLKLVSNIVCLNVIVLCSRFLANSFLLKVLTDDVALTFVITFVCLLTLLSARLFACACLPVHFGHGAHGICIHRTGHGIRIFS